MVVYIYIIDIIKNQRPTVALSWLSVGSLQLTGIVVGLQRLFGSEELQPQVLHGSPAKKGLQSHATHSVIIWCYNMLYVIMLLNDTKCGCYQNMSIYVESTSIYISFKLWELELWHFVNEALRYLQLLRNHTQHFDVDAIEPRSASTTEAKFVFAHMCHNSLLTCALHIQTRLDACNRDNYGQCTGSPFGSAVFWVTCSSKQHQAPLDAKPVWAWDMGG